MLLSGGILYRAYIDRMYIQVTHII